MTRIFLSETTRKYQMKRIVDTKIYASFRIILPGTKPMYSFMMAINPFESTALQPSSLSI